MRDVFSWALLPSRIGAGVLGAMALLGLALASVGLYGVLLYAVAGGLGRSACAWLWAQRPPGFWEMVAGESARLLGAGMAIGLGVAVFAVRPLSMFLVRECAPRTATNFVAVAFALRSSRRWQPSAPALRALRIDPAVALRQE